MLEGVLVEADVVVVVEGIRIIKEIFLYISKHTKRKFISRLFLQLLSCTTL